MKLCGLSLLLTAALALVADPTNPRLSLPNLLDVTDVSQLSWTVLNNIKLDTGRLLVGKSGGSLWSKDPLTQPDQDWTIEFVFRSTGSGADQQFSDTNGLSLFLVDTPNLKQTDNYGGPSQYDGLQFLLNHKSKPGLSIFANDGTIKITNPNQRIGNCEFSYLNSQVPFSIRVSYSGTHGVFKVQVDNNLCFRTDKLKIPSGRYTIGVAGNVLPASEEVYEVLKVQVWNQLTEDAIDDHGLMADGELRIAHKQILQNDFVTPASVRESLLARNNRFKTDMDAQQPQIASLDEIIVQNNNILKRLDALASTLVGLEAANQQPPPSESFAEFKIAVTRQSSELLDAITKLNQKVIGEVREHQYTMDELGKKVDLLMANHKEITYQYNQQESKSRGNGTNVIRYVLISIVVIVLVLIVVVYRLRHDIKHAKLL